MRLRRKKGAQDAAQPMLQEMPTDPILSGAVTPAGGFSLSEVEASSQGVPAHGRVATPPPPPPETNSEQEPAWFLLIGGQQVGPVSHERVLFLLKEREIDRRTYAWQEGMPDWIRLETIEAFKSKAESAGDARWRVVAPLESSSGSVEESTSIAAIREEPLAPSPIAEEPTVAIDRAELEKVLAKTIQSPAFEAEPMVAEEPTVAINREELEKVLAKTIKAANTDEADKQAAEKAKAAKERLAQSMTKEQLAEAQKMVKAKRKLK